ncbi:jasmonate ZIM domain-containing protein 1-like [Prosopis cineraria]|uniref:jasmonate ZIM domain-containing protein 1-like n=1 Tax=Prosopis cineraria TaxID=364024 RepID=UPI00240EC88C|nr:jasmonate ZIM domain-containing protein 1-like [Prosopis cineraria]
MSTFSDTAAHGRRVGKPAERYSFSQTCNLISQFLKGKRSSGALNLGMCGKNDPRGTPSTTMDLLTSLEKSDDSSRQSPSAMDFLPQIVENHSVIRSQAKAESKTPQMAIFYAGKVLVFDDFLPEKATEIMELATKLSSDNSAALENINEVKVPQTGTSQEASRPGSLASGSDIRYPRRASLLKFLEKRKERVIARGPYHMNPKHEGGRSGGNPEDQPCKPFDLNL